MIQAEPDRFSASMRYLWRYFFDRRLRNPLYSQELAHHDKRMHYPLVEGSSPSPVTFEQPGRSRRRRSACRRGARSNPAHVAKTFQPAHTEKKIESPRSAKHDPRACMPSAAPLQHADATGTNPGRLDVGILTGRSSGSPKLALAH